MIYQKDTCYDLYLHVQYALQIVFHAMLTYTSVQVEYFMGTYFSVTLVDQIQN